MRPFHNAAIRKRSRIVLALLLLAVVGGIVWLALRPNEPDPVYKGKRLSVWLEGYEPRFGGPINEAREAEADEAVRHIGTNAVPTLLRRLRAKDSPLTLWLVALAQKQHLVEFKFRAARDLRRQGVCGFETLGANAKFAVPELIRMYEEKRFSDSQRDIAFALGGLGPAAEQAVPALARALEDTRSDYSWYFAMLALEGIHSRPEIAMPVLVKCLGDQDLGVRRTALDVTSSFGSEAKLAVPALVRLLADPDEIVKDKAQFVLKKIDPEAAAKAEVK